MLESMFEIGLRSNAKAFSSPLTTGNAIVAPASVVNPVNDLIDGSHSQSIDESTMKQSSIF